VNDQPKELSPGKSEIVVNSDWFTAAGAVLFLVICALLLVREIRHFVWGHLSMPPHLHKGFWSIWNWVFEGIAAAYCFILAFTFPRKPVKLACVLVGIHLAGSFLMSCFRLSLSVQHVAAVSRSILSQFALAISCVAIADWLRSVVRLGPPPEPQGGAI